MSICRFPRSLVPQPIPPFTGVLFYTLPTIAIQERRIKGVACSSVNPKPPRPPDGERGHDQRRHTPQGRDGGRGQRRRSVPGRAGLEILKDISHAETVRAAGIQDDPRWLFWFLGGLLALPFVVFGGIAIIGIVVRMTGMSFGRRQREQPGSDSGGDEA